MFEDLSAEETENRRFIRVGYETELNCTIIENQRVEQTSAGKDIKGKIINISIGGISILCADKIEMGTCIQFTLDIEKSHYVVIADVVYCERQNDEYKIGMEFVNPKPALLERIKRFIMKESIYK